MNTIIQITLNSRIQRRTKTTKASPWQPLDGLPTYASTFSGGNR